MEHIPSRNIKSIGLLKQTSKAAYIKVLQQWLLVKKNMNWGQNEVLYKMGRLPDYRLQQTDAGSLVH